MSHHLFSQESPFQEPSVAYWPFAQGHSPRCNCAAMVEYSAEQSDRAAWDRDVAAERARHPEKGYDRAHDETHGIGHLLRWAKDYARRGESVKSAALIEAALDLLTQPTDPSVSVGSHTPRGDDADG